MSVLTNPADPAYRATILHLQCDGGSENMNATLLAFCQWMVELGIFNEVYLNRMLVGHTHAQIGEL